VRIELLWCEGCPNHVTAASLVKDVLSELGLTVPIRRIEVPDEAAGIAVPFPGSPPSGSRRGHRARVHRP